MKPDNTGSSVIRASIHVKCATSSAAVAFVGTLEGAALSAVRPAGAGCEGFTVDVTLPQTGLRRLMERLFADPLVMDWR